jgi:uncharacterized membrane protein YtjA (UPF0391 family)
VASRQVPRWVLVLLVAAAIAVALGGGGYDPASFGWTP